MKADSENRTGDKETKKLIRDAFQLLIDDDVVKKLVTDTIRTALDLNEKAEVRLKAKEFLFSYILPKAKTEVDMTTNGKDLNPLTPSELRLALGEIIKNEDNTKTE